MNITHDQLIGASMILVPLVLAMIYVASAVAYQIGHDDGKREAVAKMKRIITKGGQA